MCDCLETIRKRLEEHHKSSIDLELKMLIDMTDLNTEEFASRMVLPPMYYTYLVGKRRKKSYVQFNFCPFCGKRYDEVKVSGETEPVWAADGKLDDAGLVAGGQP